jgi:SAM-dependent methyltransferase
MSYGDPNRLGTSRQTPIADVGCGRGHAAHAMFKLGYERVTAMDPNAEWFTGTGYLRNYYLKRAIVAGYSRARNASIIFNNLSIRSITTLAFAAESRCASSSEP